MVKKILSLKILVFLAFHTITADAQNVELVITGFRNDKGQIVIAVFTDNENYQTGIPFLDMKYAKTGISNGEMRVRFGLAAGNYGLTLLDDENGNGEMEYNFLGIPREGFGFSDYYLKGFTKPKFDSFKVSINEYQTRRITIRIRYI